MIVLVDTNVFLDIFLDREHARPGLRVVQSVQNDQIQGLVTPTIVLNVYFYVESTHNRRRAHEIIGRVLGTFLLIRGDTESFERAWKRSDPARTEHEDYCPDFEDATLQEAARDAGADLICTINLGDFKTSPVEAIHPIALARRLQEEEA